MTSGSNLRDRDRGRAESGCALTVLEIGDYSRQKLVSQSKSPVLAGENAARTGSGEPVQPKIWITGSEFVSDFVEFPVTESRGVPADAGG